MAVGSATEREGLLDAATLFGIASLELRARTIAEGMLVGGHKSRRFGSSSEFAEHKLYTPGDELKHIDWRAYARFDRYFVRRYEEETNLDVYLVVDSSGSMAYAGGARGSFGISKWEYARTLAAALAYLAHQRSDAAGLSIFADDEATVLPPRARRDHLTVALDQLARAEAGGLTRARQVIEQVQRRMNRRALVVLVSDLLDVGSDVLEPLGVLRKRGADVLVLHTLDPDELDFPFDGVVRFEDLEGEREVQVDAPAVRDAYLEELGAFLKDVERGCSRRDLRYHLVRTDRSPVSVLREALQGPGAPR